MAFRRGASSTGLSQTSEVVNADGTDNMQTLERLIREPLVQEAMRRGGEHAFESKEVQDALLKTAKEHLTAENAALVGNKLKDWANDEEVRAKARHYAGMAMVQAGQVGQMFIGCIEQGPAGVRFLAFLAGLASCVNAVLYVISNATGLNILGAGIAIFQVCFATTTILFEASPETIASLSLLSHYQDMMIEYCKFLTVLRGRGLFYVFQGMLWLTQCQLKLSLWMIINLSIGLFMILIGVLNILMHYGIMPEHLAVKMRDAADAYKYKEAPSNP